MGSVHGYTDCPECGCEVANYNYRANAYFSIMCPVCGYHYNNETAKFLDNEKDKEIEQKGIGAYGVKLEDSKASQHGSFTEIEQMEEFVEYVENNEEKIEGAYYTIKKNDEWKLVTLKETDKTTIVADARAKVRNVNEDDFNQEDVINYKEWEHNGVQRNTYDCLKEAK